ncbi:type IV pilus biogenesis protein PilM [Pseudoduganella sp. R-34]|uniref:type IV pilus biogenesis protein PilM n=1 Tax=Pseudoduganella sp. R-34 TaxID=3404062 RepID=UPI003CE9BB1F
MRFFSKAKKEKDAWLVFAPLPQGMALATMRRQGASTPVLLGCVEAGLEGQGAEETLARAARSRNAARFRCSTLLAPSDYQLLTLEAPNVPQDELKTAVRWRMKDMLDFHVDDATFDVMAIPVERASGRTPSMFVVAARNSVIRQRQELFFGAGIDLEVIDIPETAQRNVSALLEQDGRGLALLSLGPQGGLLTVTYLGELYLARRIDVTPALLEEGDADRRHAALDRLMLEVQRSLDHFERQFGFVSISRMVLAPGCGESLLNYLSSNMYMPVVQCKLEEVIDLSGVPELLDSAQQAHYFFALGAALRQEVIVP